jgi:hypothetical protein
MYDSTVGCCIIEATEYIKAHYDSTEIVNDLTYEHLVFDFGSCLIREAGSKVYVIGPDDTVERVLYDFSLKLNDTLFTVYPQNTYISWVAQLDSTELYGTWYKVWHFQGIDTTSDSIRRYQYNVIEGIGCTNGVYYPASPYSLSTYSSQLLCFTNDMGFTTALSNPVTTFGYGYSGSFDNDSSCSLFKTAPAPIIFDNTTGVQQLAQKTGDALVVPDPVNEYSNLVFPYIIQSGTLVLLNELGQVITNVPFQNKDEMLIGDKINTPGIYCYRLTDNESGKVFSGRFISR